MRKLIMTALVTSLLGSTAAYAGSATDDTAALRDYFNRKFPGVEFDNFALGSYALDESKKTQWESQNDFPPFLDHLDKGEAIWGKKFANGNSFATCFGSDPSTVRANYPFWNAKAKKVETLEANINKCLVQNGEEKFGWKKGKIAYLSAWLGSQANGQKISVAVPQGDAGAVAAYESGRTFFYAKRGQLNLSCADCHVYNSGSQARGNLLSPVVGHTTHFPVWRGKWAKKKGDGFGTLHRRYGGCNKQVRAKPFKAQGKEYTNLEYFHAVMSNGQTITAPDYRE